MTKRTFILLSALALSSACSKDGDGECSSFDTDCGGGDGDGDGDSIALADSGTGPAPIEYMPFTVATRSLGDADGMFQVSLTSGSGAIACNLSSDHQNSLGSAGHQVIAYVAPVAGYPCPTGSHAVPTNCPTSLDDAFYAYVPEQCAYYRRWDSTGAEMGVLAATAGSIEVSGSDAACTIDVTLSFSGEQFTSSFTLYDGFVEQPWCSP